MFKRIFLLIPVLALTACAGKTERTYSNLLAYYSVNGLLRAERAPADAPFDNQDLVRNFEQIAFFSEFGREDGRLVTQQSSISLRKWTKPIRYKVSGGAATEADRVKYRQFTKRLSDLTGVQFIESTKRKPDVLILILDRIEREAMRDVLRRDHDLTEENSLMARWTRNDAFPCVGTLFADKENKAPIDRAIIGIKAETTGVLRDTCIEEELAQTMGLINDSDDVRPSIFNDDQEFALLTDHDAYLLRILYDKRLKPGMARETAMPIVRRIVREIGPGA